MKRTLKDMIAVADAELERAPAFDPVVHYSWDNWFLTNTMRFRSAIGQMVMSSGGTYFGEVGDHSLMLCGVGVTSVSDGYRGLLLAWAAAARAALAQGQAVQA